MAHIDTKTIHHPELKIAPQNKPIVPPIYQSVKFVTESYADFQKIIDGKSTDFFYSRIGNPTVRQLELLLSQLQGRDDGLCFSSGVAAITTAFMALAKAGDHVAIFYESYKPLRYIVRELFAKFNVRSSILNIGDKERIEKLFKNDPPKILFFESPTNPLGFVADIEHLSNLARSHNALLVMDNTFAGFHNHGQFPVDVFVHSLTKFASGHSGVMGGAIITRKELMDQIRPVAIAMGANLDPHAAFLILRGMKTYTLRYERQCKNALGIARALEELPKVKNVLYPGLPSHPQHALAKKQMHDFGAIVSFCFKDDRYDNAAKFLERLNLIYVAPSLGNVETLACPIHKLYDGDLSEEESSRSGIRPSTIRLAIGTENVDDLITDIKQAL